MISYLPKMLILAFLPNAYKAYHCFFQVPGYKLDGSDHAVVGMNILFEETLIELELLLFEERYTESSYIEKAEKVR